VDLDARLLLELVERRMLLALDVDVEGPVGEFERLGELLARGPGAGGRLGGAAAGRKQPGQGENGAACGGATEQLAAAQVIGHAASSIGSTTNVASGSQLRVSWSPGLWGTVPGRWLRTTTVTSPFCVLTMYCVETPM